MLNADDDGMAEWRTVKIYNEWPKTSREQLFSDLTNEHGIYLSFVKTVATSYEQMAREKVMHKVSWIKQKFLVQDNTAEWVCGQKACYDDYLKVRISLALDLKAEALNY